MSDQKLLMKANEAAAMLAIGKSTLWSKVRSGVLPAPIKIGGATRWRVADLQRFLEPANFPTNT